jgi:hypothetical protein
MPCAYQATPASQAGGPFQYSFKSSDQEQWTPPSESPTHLFSWSDPGTYCIQVKAIGKEGKETNESPCLYVNVQNPYLGNDH